MGNQAVARKVASAVAVGGGGFAALGVGFYGLLTAEAMLARRLIGEQREEPPPDASGWYGRRLPGPAIKVALLGDSGMAGYGVERPEDTPGAHFGSGIARAAGRRVYLRSFAIVGAQTSGLARQVDLALPIEPDVVIISIGTNDVTHQVDKDVSVRHLVEAVQRCHRAGAEVVVGCCPDLGTVRPINPPLRQVGRMLSRRLAEAQLAAVAEAGGRAVSLGTILGPEFDARPHDMFGPDRFHPSAAGYASFAGVLLPSALAALGLGPEDEESLEESRGEGVKTIGRAAAVAARTPGTELDGTVDTSDRRSVRGRLVELRHRRRAPSTDAEAPAPELETTGA